MSLKSAFFATCPIFLFLATSCAAQNHVLPDNLNDTQTKAFHRIAQNIPNPCPEEKYQAYTTLADLVDGDQVCHESWLVSETVSFFVMAGYDEDEIAAIANAEARNLAAPAVFTIDNRPKKGPDTAAAKIVVFSDFQCPFCSRGATTFEKIATQYPDDAQLIFKHYPLIEMHPEALPAAMCAVFAHNKGKFWETHDDFFAHQSELSPNYIVKTLESLDGKIEDVFNAETGHDYAAVIAQDMEEARIAHVRGTPTFFVNGVMLEGGLSPARLAHRIEAEKMAPPRASDEVRAKARKRMLEKCPYASEKLTVLYQLLTDDGKLKSIDIANAIPCPCPNTNGTLHECLALNTTCDQAQPLMMRIMQRINEGTSDDAIMDEIMHIFIDARMKK